MLLTFLLSLAQPALAQEEAPQPNVPDLAALPAWTQAEEPDQPQEVEEPSPDAEPPPPPSLVNIPGLMLDVAVPQPPVGEPPRWRWTAKDSTSVVRLSMRASEAYTNVRFRATNFQSDIRALDGEQLSEVLELKDDEQAELDFTLGQWELVEHPKVGPVQFLNFHVWDGFLERDLAYGLVIFAIQDHVVVMEVESSESLERVHEISGEVLDMLMVTEPPFDPAEQGLTGTVTTDAGYTLTLPEGLRTLSEGERSLVASGRIAGGEFSGKLSRLNVVRTDRLYEVDAFKCRAESGGPLEILDPAKSPENGENFKTWARAFSSAGQAKITAHGEEKTYDFSDDYDKAFHATGEGELAFFELEPQRDAYLWRVPGDVYAEPYEASIFYTAYADVGLTCMAIAPVGETAMLDAFEESVRGLRVEPDATGAPYPMPLSFSARYTRWWPTGNPFLQLYLFPIPLMLVAGYLVLKD